MYDTSPKTLFSLIRYTLEELTSFARLSYVYWLKLQTIYRSEYACISWHVKYEYLLCFPYCQLPFEAIPRRPFVCSIIQIVRSRKVLELPYVELFLKAK
jgi:hypothetical protein